MINLNDQQVLSIMARIHTLPRGVKIQFIRSIGKTFNSLNTSERIHLVSVIPAEIRSQCTDLDKTKFLFCVGLACKYEGKKTKDVRYLVSKRCAAEAMNESTITLKKAVNLLDCSSASWGHFASELKSIIRLVESSPDELVSGSRLLPTLLMWDDKEKSVQKQWQNELVKYV